MMCLLLTAEVLILQKVILCSCEKFKIIAYLLAYFK